MLRNINRMNWMILYLFGASPLLSKELITNDHDKFIKIDKDTYYLKYATSLRMSDLGYQNSKRSLNISLNSIHEYINDLLLATKTISKDFAQFEKNKI